MSLSLPLSTDDDRRRVHYDEVQRRIEAQLDGEDDFICAMATVACELRYAFDYFQWAGFYRVIGPAMLGVGPYQGPHGCLRIPFSIGVCGMAARTRQTQRVEDVRTLEYHIACSSSTRSEIVVPILDAEGSTIAVLDVDSDSPAAFREVDQAALEKLCGVLGARFGRTR